MTKNILLVDDSIIDRKVIRRILEKHIQDAVIFEMTSGHDLVDKLIQWDIRVCILNMRMPGKNGLQLLKEIKANTTVCDIPVIVTGTEELRNIEQALALGALDYFTKPLTEEAMKIALPQKVNNAIALMHRTLQIHYLSYHDELTGLYNRHFFEVELQRLDTQRQYPLSLIIGDLNGLKTLNDFYGHPAGDHALKTMADVITAACRKEDIIARWGGDEFIILLPQTDGETANRIIHRIQEQCDAVEDLPIPLSMAMGTATKNDESVPIRELIIQADKAMYRQKFVLHRETHQDMLKRLLDRLPEIREQAIPAESLPLTATDYNQLIKLLRTII